MNAADLTAGADWRTLIGLRNILTVINEVSKEAIDKVGAETAAGIWAEHCEGDGRRAELMTLGVIGQAHAQMLGFRNRIVDRPDMKPELDAIDLLCRILMKEGEKRAGELGGEFISVEVEIERTAAGRAACDICTTVFMASMTEDCLASLKD